MLNSLCLLGFIANEPIFKGKGEMQYCKFTIAVPRNYKKDGNSPADFIPCIAYGVKAEYLYTNFQKGNKICVSGRLESSSFSKAGIRQYNLSLNIKEWYFVSDKLKSFEEILGEVNNGS